MSRFSGLNRTVSSFPVDLLIVGTLGLWTIGVSFGQWEGTAGRWILGAIAVLFAPGYVFVAALFPRGAEPTVGMRRRIGPGSIIDGGSVTTVERGVLALALSVCFVPLVGMGIHYSPWGLESSLFLGVVGWSVVGVAIIAAVRRYQVPPHARFAPWKTIGRGGVSRKFDRTQTLSTVSLLLIVGFVIAGSGIGFAALSTEQGEQFTEFYLTTEDPNTGEHVAEGYPDRIPYGETDTVWIGITNQEGTPVDYTVIVLLQSFEHGVLEDSHELDTFTVTLHPGETWQEPHHVRAERTGDDLRVTYLLYLDGAPDPSDAGPETADRQAHFWIDMPDQ